MNIKLISPFLLIILISSCTKKLEEVKLDDIVLSELTQSMNPYTNTDTLVFVDSLGKEVVGKVYRDTIKNMEVNQQSQSYLYLYHIQSQATILFLADLNVVFKLIYSTRYLSTETKESADELSCMRNDTIYGGESGCLYMVTDPRNSSSETIKTFYEGGATLIGNFNHLGKSYTNVYQGALNPQTPVPLFFNNTSGIISFQDNRHHTWSLKN